MGFVLSPCFLIVNRYKCMFYLVLLQIPADENRRRFLSDYRFGMLCHRVLVCLWSNQVIHLVCGFTALAFWFCKQLNQSFNHQQSLPWLNISGTEYWDPLLWSSWVRFPSGFCNCLKGVKASHGLRLTIFHKVYNAKYGFAFWVLDSGSFVHNIIRISWHFSKDGRLR